MKVYFRNFWENKNFCLSYFKVLVSGKTVFYALYFYLQTMGKLEIP